MKIQSEQLKALQQATETKAHKSSGATGFEALLAGEIDQSVALAQTAAGQSPSLVGSLYGLDGLAVANDPTDNARTDAATLNEMAQSIDSMLDTLDAYAGAINNEQGADLRTAYGILQGMDSSIASVRAQSQTLGSPHAGMESILNELSVITRAETFKLNRGDYL